MEVENVGNNPLSETENKNSRKFWFIVFSAVGVLIVGLVIAIVVIIVNRDSNFQEDVNEDDQLGDSAVEMYFDDNEEIAKTMAETNLGDDTALKLIAKKIETAEDEKTKAMLEKDYYMVMLSIYGADESKKDEILNGLINVDKILNTFDSAEAVSNTALAYYDFDLYEKYVALAKERNPGYQSIYDVIKEEESE